MVDVSLRQLELFAALPHFPTLSADAAHLHPEHPLAAHATVDLAELADEPYILYDATPGIRNVTDAFTARGLEPRIAAKVTQIILVEALVGRGLGYGLLMSRPNALPMSSEGRPIVIRPFDPPVTVSHVVGIWPADMKLTPRASALLDFAVEKLGGYGRADAAVVPGPPRRRPGLTALMDGLQLQWLLDPTSVDMAEAVRLRIEELLVLPLF